MKILGKYTPEEYAAMWGAEPRYCHPPLLPNDGIMFYNFGSECQERTQEWLAEFSDAIDRQIQCVNQNHLRYDIKGLEQLRSHVSQLRLDKF